MLTHHASDRDDNLTHRVNEVNEKVLQAQNDSYFITEGSTIIEEQASLNTTDYEMLNQR